MRTWPSQGGPDPLDLLEFRRTVARTFEERLDRSRPLWRIDVIPELAWGGSALIWRIDHALADGYASMQMASGALWDVEQPADGPRRGTRKRSGSATSHQRVSHDRLAAMRTAMREAPQPWLDSPFSGQIGAQREVAFASVELDRLRNAARIVDDEAETDRAIDLLSKRYPQYQRARPSGPVVAISVDRISGWSSE